MGAGLAVGCAESASLDRLSDGSRKGFQASLHDRLAFGLASEYLFLQPLYVLVERNCRAGGAGSRRVGRLAHPLVIRVWGAAEIRIGPVLLTERAEAAALSLPALEQLADVVVALGRRSDFGADGQEVFERSLACPEQGGMPLH